MGRRPAEPYVRRWAQRVLQHLISLGVQRVTIGAHYGLVNEQVSRILAGRASALNADRMRETGMGDLGTFRQAAYGRVHSLAADGFAPKNIADWAGVSNHSIGVILRGDRVVDAVCRKILAADGEPELTKLVMVRRAVAEMPHFELFYDRPKAMQAVARAYGLHPDSIRHALGRKEKV